MGFRKGAWATVWSVEKSTDYSTKVRLSVSHKNKKTNNYEQDFNGIVFFIGAETAPAALELHERERIQLGDVDVTQTYDKEKERNYVFFKVFNFTKSPGTVTQAAAHTATPAGAPLSVNPDGGYDYLEDDGQLPF